MGDENIASEIDRLIAVKVMGWVEVPIGHESPGRRLPTDSIWGSETTDPRCRKWDGRRWVVMHWTTSYSPSTNFMHAWEVVERMRSIGFKVGITDDYGPWMVSFRAQALEDGSIPEHVGEGDSATAAICRAALKAIESK